MYSTTLFLIRITQTKWFIPIYSIREHFPKHVLVHSCRSKIGWASLWFLSIIYQEHWISSVIYWLLIMCTLFFCKKPWETGSEHQHNNHILYGEGGTLWCLRVGSIRSGNCCGNISASHLLSSHGIWHEVIERVYQWAWAEDGLQYIFVRTCKRISRHYRKGQP